MNDCASVPFWRPNTSKQRKQSATSLINLSSDYVLKLSVLECQHSATAKNYNTSMVGCVVDDREPLLLGSDQSVEDLRWRPINISFPQENL